MKIVRELRGLTQVELADKVGLSEPLIRRIEAGDARVKVTNRARVAESLGLTFDWTKQAIVRPSSVPEAAITHVLEDRAANKDSGEPGFDPASFEWIDVPQFDIDLSATSWSHVPICELDTNDPRQRRIVETGRFRLRIIGACMEPAYPSGAIIEFEVLHVDRSPLLMNHDYALCRSDGTATFKKLIGKHDHVYELAAINQRDYPGSFTVPMDEVVRIGRVRHIIAAAPEAKPIKIVKPKRAG